MGVACGAGVDAILHKCKMAAEGKSRVKIVFRRACVILPSWLLSRPNDERVDFLLLSGHVPDLQQGWGAGKSCSDD